MGMVRWMGVGVRVRVLWEEVINGGKWWEVVKIGENW